METNQTIESIIRGIVQPVISQCIQEEIQKIAVNRDESELFISIEEAMKITCLARQTLYAKVSKRLIPYFKQGKKLLFRESELLKWLESGKQKTESEIEMEAEAHNFAQSRKKRGV